MIQRRTFEHPTKNGCWPWLTEYCMNALAHAPIRPDCPAPPLAIRTPISRALVYPPLYTAWGARPDDTGSVPTLEYRPFGRETAPLLPELMKNLPVIFGILWVM